MLSLEDYYFQCRQLINNKVEDNHYFIYIDYEDRYLSNLYTYFDGNGFGSNRGINILD
jgi:hypothetical protein